MRTKYYEKFIRKDGAVNIPVEIRKMLGLKKHTPVIVEIDKKGTITISPKIITCPVCSKTYIEGQVNKWTGICNECMKKIETEIETYGFDFNKAVQTIKNTYTKKTNRFCKH